MIYDLDTFRLGYAMVIDKQTDRHIHRPIVTRPHADRLSNDQLEIDYRQLQVKLYLRQILWPSIHEDSMAL